MKRSSVICFVLAIGLFISFVLVILSLPVCGNVKVSSAADTFFIRTVYTDSGRIQYRLVGESAPFFVTENERLLFFQTKQDILFCASLWRRNILDSAVQTTVWKQHKKDTLFRYDPAEKKLTKITETGKYDLVVFADFDKYCVYDCQKAILKTFSSDGILITEERLPIEKQDSISFFVRNGTLSWQKED